MCITSFVWKKHVYILPVASGGFHLTPGKLQSFICFLFQAKERVGSSAICAKIDCG